MRRSVYRIPPKHLGIPLLHRMGCRAFMREFEITPLFFASLYDTSTVTDRARAGDTLVHCRHAPPVPIPCCLIEIPYLVGDKNTSSD